MDSAGAAPTDIGRKSYSQSRSPPYMESTTARGTAANMSALGEPRPTSQSHLLVDRKPSSLTRSGTIDIPTPSAIDDRIARSAALGTSNMTS